MPNQMPSINHDAAVHAMIIRWAFLVFGHIHAKRLNAIRAR